jgi:precorrin-3B synthase
VPPPIRRSDVDACPGALRLHAAADGPLARVRLPGGLLTGDQLALLGELATGWGDGHLELTSRANVQLRALRATPATLTAHLSAAGLLPSRTHEGVRNIAAPPLADPPLRQLVRELDRGLCAAPALAALPGRFLFAIGTVPTAADLTALPADDEFAILFAGTDHGLRVPLSEVVPALLAAAQAFLELRQPGAPHSANSQPTPGGLGAGGPGADELGAGEFGAGELGAGELGAGELRGSGPRAGAEPRHARSAPPWRLAELDRGPARVAAWTAAALGRPLRAASTTIGQPVPEAPIGVLAQSDGRAAVGAIVPLGRLTGDQVAVLARADRLVLTPWRGVVVPGLRSATATDWAAAVAAVGLPVEPVSRWSGVTACAGRPGCAKALADVRAAATAATVFVEGLPVHWIGCERGCGSPAAAHVRVEAGPAGWTITAPASATTLVTVTAGDTDPDATPSPGTTPRPAGADPPRPPDPDAVRASCPRKLAETVAAARRR